MLSGYLEKTCHYVTVNTGTEDVSSEMIIITHRGKITKNMFIQGINLLTPCKNDCNKLSNYKESIKCAS